ncbi:hypothetical protein [Prevotella sp. E2-28]|uniref:hypothetical protein n=1 Tax=Prevotella sp. E2-28 TaxID=2913620 RepID=UPI001EDC3764|nr:hypothetical protein [Prevotella sp. E2-28]UKK53000.1 hypothetical protein L6465_10440 [Prevotella sp. E2-28]
MNQQPVKKSGFNKMWLLLIPVVLFFLLLVAAGVGYGIYRYVTLDEDATETVEIEVLSTGEAISILDSEDLSLSRIQDVENRVAHDGTMEQEQILERRIKALKHVYTECFLVDQHSLKRLKNVYMLRAGELSERQLHAFSWFFSLSDADQQQFEYIDGRIENFADFRVKVEEEIQKSHNN